MKILKRIVFFLLIVFILIQFVRPEKNVSENSDQQIRHSLNLTLDVEQILKKSCYDCHSDNTKYPWYAEIQPMAGFLANHVEEGKEYLNFNKLSSLDRRKQRNKYREIEDVVEDGEMPLSSYTLIHNDAKLTETEREILIQWAEFSEDHVD